MQQLVLVEDRRRQAQIFAQQVPIKASDVAGAECAVDWPEAFVHRPNRQFKSHLSDVLIAQRMNLLKMRERQ
jgi:hypothetical protein